MCSSSGSRFTHERYVILLKNLCNLWALRARQLALEGHRGEFDALLQNWSTEGYASCHIQS